MSVEISVVDNRVQVFFRGNINEEDADQVKEMLRQHIMDTKTIFQIDFSNVDINHDGLGVLTLMQKLAENKFGSYCIKGLMGEMKIRFELLRIDNYFEIH